MNHGPPNFSHPENLMSTCNNFGIDIGHGGLGATHSAGPPTSSTTTIGALGGN